MKIGNETLQLLKNFASINTNIVFKPGNNIATISTGRNIFAKTTIKEEIPIEFAIYDLNSMLAMLTLINDQEVEFGEKCLYVSSAAGKFEYYYSNPEIVIAAPSGEIEHEEIYKFRITTEDIHMLMKAAAITGSPTISVTSKDGAVSLSVADRKNATASNFTKFIGTHSEPFDVFIAVQNLKVIPDTYDVCVAKIPSGKAKFLHFKNEPKNLQYWIAVEPGSAV
jgi:hypothetical protein